MKLKIWWFMKCFAGFGSVEDGSICWFSNLSWMEAHDYPKDKGGDDFPCAFHKYECHKCGKEFGI